MTGLYLCRQRPDFLSEAEGLPQTFARSTIAPHFVGHYGWTLNLKKKWRTLIGDAGFSRTGMPTPHKTEQTLWRDSLAGAER